MHARKINISGYGSGGGESDSNYYYGNSAAAAGVSGPQQQYYIDNRRSFSPSKGVGHYETQPFISSADVHIYPDNITVTPGRKTITIGRRESPRPQYSRQYQLPSGPGRQEGEEELDTRMAGRRPEMVYKTTMITQVKPREGGGGGRDSPQLLQQAQHMPVRSDPRLLHISVEPSSSSRQPETQYVRYSSSPDLTPPGFAHQHPLNLDWSKQRDYAHSPSRGSQTRYLQCSPDRTVEISFQHPNRQQQQQQLRQHYQDYDHHHHQQQQYYNKQPPQQQQQQFYTNEQHPHQQYYYQDQQEQYQQDFHSPEWSERDNFTNQYQHPSSRYSVEPQAVPSKLVYSPQPANQNIAYSKRVEKKTPSHCSSIVIVPGGSKKAPSEEPQYHTGETKQAYMDQKATPFRMDGTKKNDKEAEVDELTDLLVQNMQMTKDPDFFGMCVRCSRAIMGTSNGCSALGQLYHVACFTCGVCYVALKQMSFYTLDGATFCENCYSTNIERCSECKEPITDKMLRAVGQQYHPNCFKCCMCRCSLDGKAFTLDANGSVYCLDDFNKKYAPRCSGCGEMIVPQEGKGEAERVVVLDKNFHLECHRCEDCGKLLSSRFGGDGCFPLDDSILCGRCNAHRMEKLTNPGATCL